MLLKEYYTALKRHPWILLLLTAAISIPCLLLFASIKPLSSATLSAHISSARLYYISDYRSVILNGEQNELILPIHIKWLKSDVLLKKLLIKLHSQGLFTEHTATELSQSLTIKILHSNRGILSLQAKAPTQESAETLVTAWAQTYHKYNQAIMDVCLKKIVLAHSRLSLNNFDILLKQALANQASNKKLLTEIKTHSIHHDNTVANTIAETTIALKLNDIESEIIFLNEKRNQMLYDIQNQTSQIAQISTDFDINLDEFTFLDDQKEITKIVENNTNNSTAYGINISRDSFPGYFFIDSTPQQSGWPIAPKPIGALSIVIISFLFSCTLLGILVFLRILR